MAAIWTTLRSFSGIVYFLLNASGHQLHAHYLQSPTALRDATSNSASLRVGDPEEAIFSALDHL
jgi:hypothetical protein